MLRKIRITLAAVFFVCITWLFLDFTGTAYGWLAWMTKLQFLEALLALNLAVIIGLVVVTLVFGRIYCSIICPSSALSRSGINERVESLMMFDSFLCCETFMASRYAATTSSRRMCVVR